MKKRKKERNEKQCDGKNIDTCGTHRNASTGTVKKKTE